MNAEPEMITFQLRRANGWSGGQGITLPLDAARSVWRSCGCAGTLFAETPIVSVRADIFRAAKEMQKAFSKHARVITYPQLRPDTMHPALEVSR